MEEIRHGWLPGITEKQFLEIDALTAKEMVAFCRSAAHYKAMSKETESDALWYAHNKLSILDPDAANKLYDECVEWQRLSLSHNRLLRLHDMHLRFQAFFGAKYVYGSIESQGNKRFPGVANVYGVQCKIRPDLYLLNLETGNYEIVDLIYTDNAAEADFTSEIFMRSYHIEAAFNAIVAEELSQTTIDTYTLIAIERIEPHALREFVLSKSLMDYTKSMVRRKLSLFRGCLVSDIWEGYPSSSVTVELPRSVLMEY